VRISLRMVVIVLAILTIAMTVTTVYTYIDSLRTPKTDYLRTPKSGLLIQAREINGVSSHDVVITDPHPYLIEAVENPGDKIYIGGRDEETAPLYDQLLRPGGCYVEYEGKYYVIGKVEVELGLEPSLLSQLPVGFSALGVCWVVVGYSYHRKKKETTRHEKG